MLAAAFLAAVLAKQIVTPITTWISDSVGWSAMNALRRLAFDARDAAAGCAGAVVSAT